MRLAVTIGFLLFTGAAGAQSQAQNQAWGTEPPPLCGEDPAATTVRIDVDAEGMTINPKDCTVSPGTSVVWWEDGTAPFEVNFPGATPDQGGAKNFKSKQVDTHQEAGLKAKKVAKRASFGYSVTINGTELDPSIIVDPH